MNALEVSAYPNPSNGAFNVVAPSALDINVLDITGRTLLMDRLEVGMNTIDLTSFGKGIYILKYTDGKTVSSLKLQIK